jgi:molybdenum cofactor biosynthesis enzyme MoaA
MKLYVIPVQNQCNANCIFCITKYRQETGFGEYLSLSDIPKIKNFALDKIEITGGGEPLLHPKINTIIEILSQNAATQIYTNGILLTCLSETALHALNKICISRAHYDQTVNHRIMRLMSDDNNIKRISKKVDVKMSAVLCRSGVNSQKEITKYMRWAVSVGAKEVVFRRMFEFDYPKDIKERENLPLDKVIADLKQNYEVINEDEDKIYFSVFGLPVEIELRSCDCELTNLVLRPNGKLYVGWGKNEYSGSR